MSRVFGIPGDGRIRLVVSRPYLQKLQTFIARRFGREENAAVRTREAKERLLAHPYLIVHPRIIADEEHKKARVSRCIVSRDGLCERLDRGEIIQHGIERATGHARLTSGRLRDRLVRLLDLDNDWLLMSLERHPGGGAETFLVQWWLYGKRQKAVYLIHVQEQAAVQPMTTARVGGAWRPLDTSLEDDFYSRVRELLGDPAADALRRATQFQDVALCTVESEVFHKVSEIVGFDAEAAERRREGIRASALEAKYGSVPGPRVAWVSVDAGIRLGFERTHIAQSGEQV